MENELFKPLNLLADIQVMMYKKDYNIVFMEKEAVTLKIKIILEEGLFITFGGIVMLGIVYLIIY